MLWLVTVPFMMNADQKPRKLLALLVPVFGMELDATGPLTLGSPTVRAQMPRSHDKLPKAHFYGKSNLPSFVENELNMQCQQGLYLVSLVIWDLLYLV